MGYDNHVGIGFVNRFNRDEMNYDEGNELIAKYLGSKLVNNPYIIKETGEMTDFWHWTKPESGYPKCAVTGVEWSTAYVIGNFKYHKSFDWLIPVSILVLENLGSIYWSDGHAKEDQEKANALVREIKRCAFIKSDLYKRIIESIQFINTQKLEK